MKCPVCDSKESKVTNSRMRLAMIHRKRKCKDCDMVYTTYEVADTLFFEIIERLEDFQAEMSQFMIRVGKR